MRIRRYLIKISVLLQIFIYKYSFVGIMLDWIKQGMKEDYEEIARMIAITLHGGIANSIRNFTKAEE